MTDPEAIRREPGRSMPRRSIRAAITETGIEMSAQQIKITTMVVSVIANLPVSL
ncbi:hypothetical protein [Nocardia camponoti]|uniref:Uncharacterized protein n=1 Tax=Nocardia camponoti TaxID=1616106 RepID=A0A917QCK6_9NOCA|nr:hypothetical protein [Nocardia camponoti]GGK44211.1 hypothetical protein GCM10011591_14680 [Nocardia camponoti]